MQLEEIQIPVYFGGFIDVFWDSDGTIPFVMLMCIMILSFARTAMSESP